MTKLHFPFVNMPREFVTLLKSNLPATTAHGPVFEIIRPNRALFSILENAFKEFDDGRGVEKIMTALGWSNFRDRMASVYVYKSIYGDFPGKSDMELVDEIKNLENRFIDQSVNGISRVFLLGFYLRLANISIKHREDTKYEELKIPVELDALLSLSQGRSERVDWLILILLHLQASLGEKMLSHSLISGKKFDELYQLLPQDAQEHMSQNLLAYGASIQEADVFLYDRV